MSAQRRRFNPQAFTFLQAYERMEDLVANHSEDMRQEGR